MLPAHRQAAFAIRLDWGRAGAETILDGADVAVLVDVLSFSTAVTVAVEAGIEVWPYRWNDESAREFAAQHQAVLAAGRRRARPGQISLSPATIAASRGVSRLVLPSPNGSTIAARLAEAGIEVLAASLRNASAVAAHLANRNQGGDRIAVIAAGELRPGGELRPAVEDLWGAGAVISALGRFGSSPEAEAAAAAFAGVRVRLRDVLPACASGQELVDAGFEADVRIAAELDVSAVVPRLRDGCFRATRSAG